MSTRGKYRCGVLAVAWRRSRPATGWTSSHAIHFGKTPTVFLNVSCAACHADLRDAAADKLVELFGDVATNSTNRRLIAIFRDLFPVDVAALTVGSRAVSRRSRVGGHDRSWPLALDSSDRPLVQQSSDSLAPIMRVRKTSLSIVGHAWSQLLLSLLDLRPIPATAGLTVSSQAIVTQAFAPAGFRPACPPWPIFSSVLPAILLLMIPIP